MNADIIGQRIREVRNKYNLTMNEFGRYFGMGGQTVSKWEKGLKTPDLQTMIKMSEIFERPLDFFVSEVFPSEHLQETLGYNEGFKNGYDQAREEIKENINNLFFNII